MSFPKSLAELKKLIVDIWKPTIDSLRRNKQDNIQFQDEGIDQGTAGEITTVDFTGAGVSASNTGSTLVVNINPVGVTAPSISGSNGSFSFSTVTFGNLNGLSFYSSNGSMVGSYTVPSTAGLISNINISAGTTSNNLSAVTFSDLNGISFGLNGSVVTASHNALTTAAQSDQVVNSLNGSTGQISLNVGSSLSASTNGSSITFGLASNITTALQSAGAYLTTAMQSNAGSDFVNTSAGLNLTNISATFNSNSISLSVAAPVTTAGLISAVKVSAGTLSSNRTDLTFDNSNGVSFGLETNGIITATVATNYQSQGAYLTTAMESDAGSRFVYTSAGLNLTNISATLASNSVSLSVAPQTNQTLGIYASSNTTMTSSGTIDARSLTFRGLGVASVGYSNNEVLISVPAGGGGITNINLSAGTTSNNASNFTFADSNGISFGLNAGTITATVKTDYLTTAMASNRGTDFVQATAAFAGTNASGTIASNGISVSVNSQSSVPQNASLYGLGNTTQNSSTVLSLNALSFNGLGGNTVGYSNGSIQISGVTTNGLISTARASNDGIGLNTAQTNVTWTVNSAGLSLNASGYAGTGTSATNASVTLNSNGLAISVAAPGGGGSINFSAGTTSNNLSQVSFKNTQGISFGLDSGTITASHNGLTTARASTDGIGLATAQSNVTWTVNSNGLSLNANGYAGTGTSATNASVTLNSNGLAISVAAPGGGAPITYSGIDPYRNFVKAGLQYGNGTIVFDNLILPNVQFDRVLFPISVSNATNSSGSHTVSLAFGVYSRNDSTFSLITSNSTSVAATYAGTVGSYSLHSGLRNITMALTTTLTEGNYWFAFVSSTASGGANGSYSVVAVSGLTNNWNGYFGSVQNNSNHSILGRGYVGTANINLPSALQINSLVGFQPTALRPAAIALASSTI